MIHLLVVLTLMAQDPKPQEPKKEQEILIVGRSENLVGDAQSATQGTVGREELQRRPLLRPGEVLETVPGLIVTQHSGAGKANQYFLRGFNLDHGTDFATWIDGMPINLPTHGHGQGYTDVNFLIPELIEGVEYRKGPYYAETGDFSAAGAAMMRTFTTLPTGMATIELGQFDYERAMIAHSLEIGDGRLILAVEGSHYDGPWDVQQNFVRMNGFVRYAQGDATNGWDVTLMAYGANWIATDQVARRAVDQGLIDRFGSLDPTSGGRTHRYSLSGQWRSGTETSSTKISAYVIEYKLDLFSNFTYFLDNPPPVGDQFEQLDHRYILGANAAHQWILDLGGLKLDNEVGIGTRNDFIPEVGLFKTDARRRISTVRNDRVYQNSMSIYGRSRTQWLPWLRSEVGVRGDLYRFEVDSSIDANSGVRVDGIVSPKGSLVFGPWAKTEFYLNAGLGFHSNDARGTTIKVDPNDGVSPAARVDPLVQATGFDIGARTAVLDGLQSTVTFFLLDLDSELVFVGDAGLTEPSRPSRRTGVEFANYYTPLPWLTIDADLCLSRSRFRDSDPAGKRIPDSIATSFAGGISIQDLEGFLGSLRIRHFGPRPLVEDNSARSNRTTLVNGRVGYKHRDVTFAIDVFNIFNSKSDDITYFYGSQLAGEAAPVDDFHFHPVEPRNFRASVTITF